MNVAASIKSRLKKHWLLGTALLATGFAGAGCTSASLETRNAPRSDLGRDNALTLARIAATAIGGEVFAISQTGSMKPTLDECSIVTVEHTPYDRLQIGDIVVYRNPEGTAIIHRLYARQGNNWLVLGDNNVSIDHEAVTERNLVGRVCAIFYTSSSFPTENPAFASPSTGEKPKQTPKIH